MGRLHEINSPRIKGRILVQVSPRKGLKNQFLTPDSYLVKHFLSNTRLSKNINCVLDLARTDSDKESNHLYISNTTKVLSYVLLKAHPGSLSFSRIFRSVPIKRDDTKCTSKICCMGNNQEAVNIDAA